MRMVSFLQGFFIAGSCFLFIACGPAGEGSEKEPTPDTVAAIPDPREPGVSALSALDGCYAMFINGDTAGLQVEVKNDTARGELFYHWKEKDHNDGSFTGTFRDSVLTGFYRYRSEGMYSVRQVAFKLSGDTLYQGNGEMLSTRDSFLFKNPAALVFDLKHPFLKTACAN